MTLRPALCRAVTSAAVVSTAFTSYTAASTLRSSVPDSCHCQVRPGVGRHQPDATEVLVLVGAGAGRRAGAASFFFFPAFFFTAFFLAGAVARLLLPARAAWAGATA